jgi:hypothetical protein
LNAKAQSENDDRGIVLAVGEDKAGNKPVNIGRAGHAQRNVSCLPAGAGFHDGLGPLHLVKDPARLIE